jgi:hypothetical protein
MPTIKTLPETPFGTPDWPWNHVPNAGHPSRARSQSVVAEPEREAGVKLIGEYRAQEDLAAANDIAGREHRLQENPRAPLAPVEREAIRRELSQCDHAKWISATERLREIRLEAFVLAEKFKRLVKSLDDELLAAEQRLDSTGIPIYSGGEFALHHDVVCRALWSQRHTVEKTLVVVREHRDGVGSIQWLATDEVGVPFEWL